MKADDDYVKSCGRCGYMVMLFAENEKGWYCKYHKRILNDWIRKHMYCSYFEKQLTTIPIMDYNGEEIL